MTSGEMIESVITRMADLDQRAKTVFGRLNDERIIKPIAPSSWHAAQILDHLMRANAVYLEKLPAAIAQATAGSDAPVGLTWFGKALLKAAGPGGNVPAPKPLHPTSEPLDRSILDAYLAQTAQLKAVAESARGVNLGSVRINNPFMRVFRMSLADVFEILVQHTERHIGQIEAAHPR